VTVASDTVLSLTELVDATVVTAALGRALGPGVGAVRAVEVLEHKPGRRALLRYETEGAGTVYGKVFPDAARAERTHDLMESVGDAVGAAAPPPLWVVPALGLVLYEPLVGPSLDALVGTDALLDGLQAAGRWLTILHGADLDLDRVLDLEHEAANAAVWSATTTEAFPDQAVVSARLTALLCGGLPTPAQAVPIHKDFHYQHVISGADFGVVDVDEARMGDRLFDVGHFLANLELLAHRAGVAPDERDRWTVAFTMACEVAPGDEASLRWYEAYTCVKLAKQLATGQGPRPRPEGDARHAEVEWALAHGLAVIQP
jgi:hypothetical protein